MDKNPGIAYSVKRLTTGWMVRGSYLGGASFPALVHQTGPAAHPVFYITDSGPFPGVKRPECGVDRSPPLAPKLKKEWSYTSTPSMGLRGLF